MPSNRISLAGGFLSLERTPGVSDEYALTIHLSHTQLAELFGPVIDIQSLTLEARQAKKRAIEAEERARKKVFDDRIAQSLELGRTFHSVTKAYVEDGHTDVEAIALVSHDMCVSQVEVRQLRTLARKHDQRARDEQVFKLYKAGKTNAQIGRKLDLHPVSVARIIANMKRRQSQLGGAK